MFLTLIRRPRKKQIPFNSLPNGHFRPSCDISSRNAFWDTIHSSSAQCLIERTRSQKIASQKRMVQNTRVRKCTLFLCFSTRIKGRQCLKTFYPRFTSYCEYRISSKENLFLATTILSPFQCQNIEKAYILEIFYNLPHALAVNVDPISPGAFFSGS